MNIYCFFVTKCFESNLSGGRDRVLFASRNPSRLENTGDLTCGSSVDL